MKLYSFKQLTLASAFTFFSIASLPAGDCKPHCGTIPFPSNTGHITPKPILHSPEVWSFVTEPDLHPMKVVINNFKPGTSPGFIFVAPYTASSNAMIGQTGSLILDNNGVPFWFRPLSSPNLMNTDFRVQKLGGKPVLTFWQGTVATPPTYTNSPEGSSEPGSCFYILDHHYRVIRTVNAHKGYISDVHEFLITPRNSALLLSTKKVPMDLTPFGGPKEGFLQDFAIQEIDLCTNKLLFFWNALEHIYPGDSHQPASSAVETDNVWDAYHLNSIGLTENEDEIILSSRNMWAIYRINKRNGHIVWQLGGVHNDFTIEPGAQFSWQHDARFLDNNEISMFDDNCCESSTIPPETPPAHGLILQLDLAKMTASLKRSYFHNPNLQVATQGSVQRLENGNRFVGWGQDQFYSEFLEAGNTEEDPAVNFVYDAQMPGENVSYRAFKNDWVGIPYYPPKIAAKKIDSVKTTVFASWNGSTETKAWRVLAGCSEKRLHKIAEAPKTGFETAIEVETKARYFQVQALNNRGEVIGTSQTLKE